MATLGWSQRLRAAAAVLGLAAALAVAGPVRAVQPDEVLPDPKLEQRARGISSGLRCLVCQNQSIDDSDAPLARDLRLLVREKLSEGATDEEVRSFLVDRYGEFVLLKPAFNAHTLILWAGPFVILAIGAVVVWTNARRRKVERAAASALSRDEEAALKRVIEGPEATS
jgi:cytochrome c-type biogenesis protein CcmH